MNENYYNDDPGEVSPWMQAVEIIIYIVFGVFIIIGIIFFKLMSGGSGSGQNKIGR